MADLLVVENQLEFGFYSKRSKGYLDGICKNVGRIWIISGKSVEGYDTKKYELHGFFIASKVMSSDIATFAYIIVGDATPIKPYPLNN
ncbi:MAG: hypothetical protein EOO38_18145, partial [Cytophagaceae bacterium]